MVNTKTIVTSDLRCDYPNLSDPDPRTPYLPKFHELPGYLPRSIYRDRKPDTLSFRIDSSIDSDNSATLVSKRASAVARVNWGICLDQVLKIKPLLCVKRD
jgi:hypothetical protein